MQKRTGLDPQTVRKVILSLESTRNRLTHLAMGDVIDCQMAEQIVHLLKPLQKSELVSEFCRTIIHQAGQIPDLGRCRNILDKEVSDVSTQIELMVVGLFSAPYNPQLGFEALHIQTQAVSAELVRKFPDSCARPALLLSGTPGVNHPTAVALFPENWMTTVGVVESNTVLYFINRFVDRIHRITIPAIVAGKIAAFSNLSTISCERYQRACNAWVYMHEAYHRRGSMPLPDCLKAKSTRSRAAGEELRVDLQSILQAWQWANGESGNLWHDTALIILSERLVRYPIESDPQKNYDARGTQALVGYLESKKVLHFNEHNGVRIERLEYVLEVISELSDQIECWEAGVASDTERKMWADEFIPLYGGYNMSSKTYELKPLHRMLRECVRGC